MRDDIIDILNMISPSLDTEDEDFNILEAMESEDIIEFIAELEDKFQIEIAKEDITEENFENIDTIIEMIETLQ